jgi:hypothetical protein
LPFEAPRAAALRSSSLKKKERKKKRRRNILLILILHSKDDGYKGGAINTQDSAFTNTKAGALSPLEHVPKRHKVSVVGDKKLSLPVAG